MHELEKELANAREDHDIERRKLESDLRKTDDRCRKVERELEKERAARERSAANSRESSASPEKARGGSALDDPASFFAQMQKKARS